MRTREQIYRQLVECLAEFVRLTDVERFNDVNAEQQVALTELLVALGRARDIARAVALAFAEKPPQKH